MAGAGGFTYNSYGWTQTLSGANTYGGATAIPAGTVVVSGGNDRLPTTTTVTLGSGTTSGVLQLGDATAARNQTLAGLATSGTGTANAVVGGYTTASTLTINNSSAVGYAGLLGGASGNQNKLALTKNGAGTLTLSGANTYNGNTTISVGTLALGSAGSIAGSPVITVAGGATLDVTAKGSGGALVLGQNQTLKGSGTIEGTVSPSDVSLTINGTLAPGASVGKLTHHGKLTLAGGGTNEFEMDSASGTAGSSPGWDLTDVSGSVDVTATSGNRFIFKLVSLAASFSKDSAYSWNAIGYSGNISGFDPGSFTISDAGFTNNLGGGSFFVENVSSPSKAIRIGFTNNHAPEALATNYARAKGLSLKIRVPNLITNRTSDADGQWRILERLESDSGLMKSANGFTVTTNSTFIFYTNTVNDAQDTINYVVVDQAPYRAGDTRRYATNTITITVAEAAGGQAKQIEVVGGKATVNFAGIPGLTYDVERAEDVDFTVNLGTVFTTNLLSGGDGLFIFVDDDPPGSQAYYRLKYTP